MTPKHRVRLSKLSLGLIVALAAAPAFAQSTSAGIGGQVEYGWEYHTIGWEWTDDYSQFYVDGQPTIRFDSTAAAFDVFNKPAWLIVGGGPCSHDYGTALDIDSFDYDIDYFDYIQIYQKNDGSVMYVAK